MEKVETLIDIKTLALALDYSLNTVKTMVKNDEITYYRSKNGRYRFKLNEVLDDISSRPKKAS